MTNRALPKKSTEMLERHLDRCQNLGLILDKFAPWGEQRGVWDLTMRSTVRRQGQNQLQTLSGGEAKGLWLSTTRRALQGESPSLFEVSRTDVDLMRKVQERWREIVSSSDGLAFSMVTAERLVAGLGASHVLETALTLDRNTGLPYLPGSTVKGLARAWGLIEVAEQVGVTLDQTVIVRHEEKILLNVLAETLITEPTETLMQELSRLPVSLNSADAKAYIEWFRFIFGWQGETGAICFVDAIYAGEQAPRYAADVMTPHYVHYYTENGGKPPAEDDNPNPVSFITVDVGNRFAFGLVPRRSAFAIFSAEEQTDKITTALSIASDWLQAGLSQMGIGSKTAAGYGFFSRRSLETVIGG